MRERRLDLGVPVTEEQWEQLGRTAKARGGRAAGFEWKGDEFGEIHLFARDADSPAALRSHLEPDDRYGRHELPIATFLYNGGRPYADVRSLSEPDEPGTTNDREHAMQREINGWVRNRWHDLLRDSGVHYVRGHGAGDELRPGA